MEIRMACLFDTTDTKFDTSIFDITLYIEYLTETLNFADSMLKSGIRRITESVHHIISLFDTIDARFDMGAFDTDALYVTDSHLIGFVFSESLHIIDSIVKSGIKQLSENINAIDSMLKSGIRYLSESLHTIDSILYRIFTNEVVSIIDSISNITGTKIIYETLHIVNWFRGKLRRKLSDWTKIFKEY